MEKNNEKAFGIIGLIALRKSDLYNLILAEASKKQTLSENDKNKIRAYISSMKNEKFLTKEEKKDKKINKELNIMKDLDLNLKEIIEKALKK